jgi:hypothetical protein
MWTRGPTGNPIKTEDVKVVSTFNDIGPSYRVEGLLSAMVLPLMKNNVENRKVLIKQLAAQNGINAVVGLQPNVGDVFYKVGIAVGILAQTGTSVPDGAVFPAKFIVCLPPINFKIDKDPSMANIDSYLRDSIQFHFSSMKGYYVYRSDLPITDLSNMHPSVHSLGIPADYVLQCNVEGYDETGNITVKRVKTLKIIMSLFDIKDRKIVWTQATEGVSGKSILLSVLKGVVFGGVVGAPLMVMADSDLTLSDDFKTVDDAMSKIIDTVPPAIPGFKGRQM